MDNPAVASCKSSRKPLSAETVCPACGGELKVMGETISEQPEIINTAFKFIETVRSKLACSRCDVIIQAPLPPKPIERSYASPRLLARILVSKYYEHIPLYRQSEILCFFTEITPCQYMGIAYPLPLIQHSLQMNRDFP